MPFAPFRERLEEVIRKLASTPGIDVKVKKLGRPVNADGIRKAEKALGCKVPPALRAVYAAANGFEVRWAGNGARGELGLLPLEKVARSKLLWDLSGGQGAVAAAIDKRGVQLTFGDANEKLALTPQKYFDALLATAGLVFEPCFSGKADARAQAKTRLAAEMRKALPGWKLPAWLAKS